MALALYERGWSSVELVKDCGLTPYLLYKNHNCSVSMVEGIILITNNKEINPCGKIYVALDANSHWMNWIIWTNPDFIRSMDNCDVIATSCRAMARHLNEKWPWNIECIPNGYYGFDCLPETPVFKDKENIILTVGRLGTEQKATNILMEAFAEIAMKIPDWKLRLVGSIEDGFHSYAEDYSIRFPNLKTRVFLEGPIGDRRRHPQCNFRGFKCRMRDCSN